MNTGWDKCSLSSLRVQDYVTRTVIEVHSPVESQEASKESRISWAFCGVCYNLERTVHFNSF